MIGGQQRGIADDAAGASSPGGAIAAASGMIAASSSANAAGGRHERLDRVTMSCVLTDFDFIQFNFKMFFIFYFLNIFSEPRGADAGGKDTKWRLRGDETADELRYDRQQTLPKNANKYSHVS
jgi:hypothetical protein